ncbi:hypothetical protein D0B54_18670 [Solimonas sp. K1W22B-7]|uniref:hypothetical protein n=1 Tax=Solimonas sp. K1W22B-7 TaxID=2303331 RepID=UPI000E3358BD|nr:hypothetical protein [Solimonas sp. K1W22B-7]AXQ30582.1 hypothetical protein D0B54_18670 [Solimonas sp. K1W22B-7]
MDALARYAHVPAKLVRHWAWVDFGMILNFSLPPVLAKFVAGLYWLNGKLGGTTVPPVFDPTQVLFAAMTGALYAAWVLARLLHPAGLFAAIDAGSRLIIAAVAVYTVLAMDGAPVLWLLFAMAVSGAIAQGWAVLRPQQPGVAPAQA